MEKLKLPTEEKHNQLLATKSSSSYPSKLWDCGSTLYDSFELNSFKRQLDSAITNSPRTLSMPHLRERSLHALTEQPPPSTSVIMSTRKSFNFSRSFHKLLRSFFKSNNKSSTTTSFQVPEKYNSKERFYVVYDKSGPVLSTIPEVPEFEIGALSPEISYSLIRRSASERFTPTAISVSCASLVNLLDVN